MPASRRLARSRCRSVACRADDAEIAELAGLSAGVTGWDTDLLMASLHEQSTCRWSMPRTPLPSLLT
jgi:hypothetical protein